MQAARFLFSRSIGGRVIQRHLKSSHCNMINWFWLFVSMVVCSGDKLYKKFIFSLASSNIVSISYNTQHTCICGHETCCHVVHSPPAHALIQSKIHMACLQERPALSPRSNTLDLLHHPNAIRSLELLEDHEMKNEEKTVICSWKKTVSHFWKNTCAKS